MMRAIDTSRREATLSPIGTPEGAFELRTGFQRTLNGGGERITDSTAAMKSLRKPKPLAGRASGLTIASHDEAISLDLVLNQDLARLHDEAMPAPGMTPQEIEADRALCAMLEIDPEQLAEARFERLRRLWA
jgi:hypothetical protein